MPLLLDVDIFSSSITVLIPNGQFWGYTIIAFSERYFLKISNLSLQKCGKRDQTITKCVTLFIHRMMHFHGFGSSGDAKNIPTEGSVLSVCVLLIYFPVILCFLPSESETITAYEYIITGKAQCIWFKRREEAIISQWPC